MTIVLDIRECTVSIHSTAMLSSYYVDDTPSNPFESFSTNYKPNLPEIG